MATPWTSKYAILQDLSEAQGRVPVAVDGTVGAGEKPPSLCITEETEEEFFRHCMGECEATAAPDLGLIKKMLDMVRDTDMPSDDEDMTKTVLEISKLDPLSSEFIPRCDTSTPIEKPKIKKKIRKKNVALESILQSISNNINMDDKEPMKLLKPNDFISEKDVENGKVTDPIKQSSPDNKKVTTFANKEIKTDIKVLNDNISESVAKVNDWFKIQTAPLPKKPLKVTLEVKNMFRKKTATKNESTETNVVLGSMSNMFKKKDNFENLKAVSPKKGVNSQIQCYVPSARAQEYYNEIVERCKVKQLVKEDIWMQAERKMKEIDERKREVAARSQSSSSNGTKESEGTPNTKLNDTEGAKDDPLNIVKLPQHRHLLTGKCIVCQVMTKDNQQPHSSVGNNTEQVENNPEQVENNCAQINEDLSHVYIEKFENIENNTQQLVEINENVPQNDAIALNQETYLSDDDPTVVYM